jgi:nucleoid-associated protein YgaU
VKTKILLGAALLVAAAGCSSGLPLVPAASPSATTHSAAATAPSSSATTHSAAAATAPSPSHSSLPGRYVVRAGDTLQSIAVKFYGSAADWTAIQHANSALRNIGAGTIYPGEVLVIPVRPVTPPPAMQAQAPVPVTTPTMMPTMMG